MAGFRIVQLSLLFIIYFFNAIHSLPRQSLIEPKEARALSAGFLESLYKAEPGTVLYLGGIEFSQKDSFATKLTITDLTKQQRAPTTATCDMPFSQIHTSTFPIPVKTWLPCTIPTFQWQITKYNTPDLFDLQISHT